MPRHYAIAMYVFLAIFARAHGAEPASVELQIVTRAFEVGETVNLQLVCKNTALPGTPSTVLPDGLDLKLVNPTPSSSTRTQIINGRRTSQSSYTYHLQLTATKEGNYTLGPISVNCDGQTYSTKPVRLSVRNLVLSSDPDGDRMIFAKIEVSPTTLYLTESYKATLVFGIRKVRIDGRVHDLDLLRHVLDARSSQLSVFANGQANRSERWLVDSAGVRHRYEIFRVVKTLTADKAGAFTIGPVFLKARYPTRLRRGFFGRPEIAAQRPESARATGVNVEIKSPPVEGRPNDYNGAIGRFAMTVSAKPTRVTQGQPITLTIALRGSPLQSAPGPDLRTQPELTSRFDFTKDELSGDIENGSKVFRRAVFPKQSGEQTIPPISWSYFDPHRERYFTLTSKPVNISVDPPADGDALPISVVDRPAEKDNTTTLTVLRGGISPNYLDADSVLANQSIVLTPAWTATLLGSPLVWLLFALTTRHRTRLRSDVNFARRRRARKRAMQSLREAAHSELPAAQLHAIGHVVTEYVSDRYGLAAGALTPHELRKVLSGNGLTESTASEIAEFVESCDAVRYAPGSQAELSTLEAAATARRWVNLMERGKS